MTYKLPSSSSFGSRLVCGVTAAFFLCLLSQVASSQTYVNTQNQFYYVPDGPQVPNLPYTAIVNKAIFSISYNNNQNNQFQWVEPWQGTLFYTNIGEMMVNAPIPTNGFLDFLSSGVGYEFDLQEGNSIGGVSNVLAGTFYNPGTIHCNSVLDGNTPPGTFFFDGFEFQELGSIGGCLIQATNIVNPGNIVVGSDGELNMNGQNVDLSRSVLTLEQGLVSSNNVNAAISTEGEGFDTNGDWNPFLDLTATNAQASFPDFLSLSFPNSYFAAPVQTGPSNVVWRVVFIVNANTNVQANVYIAPSEFFNEGALIQWSGTFFDPATGLTDTNYLYLFHYYPGSFGLTNFFPILSAGTPAVPGFIGFFSYLWSQPTPFPISEAPNAPGFQDIFNDNFLTNAYEFFNATLSATTVSTNQSGLNPSGSVTNLPNQLVINATHELKMDLAQITGPNYMSLNATNQFDGAPGATILAPFSDLNLAVTNGYPHPLTISNLLAASIPEWSGTLNEWSTRWTSTDINGITNDFRVMLVYSDLTPVTAPQVRNLTLTATNLVISDVLNIYGATFANAQTLTLTTNAYGGGATSPDGELNMQNEAAITWSWNGSFPYVSLLTNNGAIRMPNWANFISTAPATNGVPTTPAVAATSTLIEAAGKNVAQGSEVSIGGATPYIFTNNIGAGPAFLVKIGSTFDASLTNLASAINAGKGSGTIYSSGTFKNASVTAGPLVTNLVVGSNTNVHGFFVTANITGPAGDSIATFTTGTNLMWTNSASGAFLAGGASAFIGYTNISYYATNYVAIDNSGLISDQGSTIWVSNFMSGGVFDNGSNSFQLTSWTTTLTNGSLTAGGDVSLASDTLFASNVMLQVGRSLTLEITNSISDGSVSNGSVWIIGTNSIGFDGYGLVLPFLPSSLNNLPVTNNVLGTSIYMQTPPPNKRVENDWAGLDLGASTNGYGVNNMAVGQLFLNSMAANSVFYFTGPPGSANNNAIYVDRLVLQGYAGLGYPNWQGLGGVPTLIFNNNTNAGRLTIYYADALSTENVSGGSFVDVSSILNGLNGGHLVWIPQYIGYFSGTNVTYPDGTTVRLNAGVYTGGGSAQLDSNGNGTPNAGDPAPVFLGNQIDFQAIRVGNSNKLTWHSPPGATNLIIYSTNLINWNTAATVINPPTVPPPAGWPITNVLYEPLSVNIGTHGSTTNNCWYRVRINQDNTILYGQ